MDDQVKTYSELSKLGTLHERLEYLKSPNLIGEQTLGSHRYLVQAFYSSSEWKKARRSVIIRDNGNELGLDDHEIFGKVIVHHINPITVEDLIYKRPCLTDPDNLVCSSELMHSAIHYGADLQVETPSIDRKANDTCPWRK